MWCVLLLGMVFCEGDVVVGVYVMDGVIICVGVNVWVIKL